jgi:hypothetical protein
MTRSSASLHPANGNVMAQFSREAGSLKIICDRHFRSLHSKIFCFVCITDLEEPTNPAIKLFPWEFRWTPKKVFA